MSRSPARYIQQALLEEDKTAPRLQKEKEILDQTLKFYAAQSALSSVFSSSGEPGSSSESGSSDSSGGEPGSSGGESGSSDSSTDKDKPSGPD